MSLVIEYVLEGQQRGYNFTTPTHAYPESVIKHIWRNAMPRGQGWGGYIGAESLKCFPVTPSRMAVSRVIVTDSADESGRRGIRRAVIDVMNMYECAAYLRDRLQALPSGVQNDAAFIMNTWARTRLLERHAPKVRKAGQLIFAHKYSTLADWRVVEAVILRLALSPSHPLKRAQGIAFTTLALGYHDEMYLVGLPSDRAADVREIPVVKVD